MELRFNVMKVKAVSGTNHYGREAGFLQSELVQSFDNPEDAYEYIQVESVCDTECEEDEDCLLFIEIEGY